MLEFECAELAGVLQPRGRLVPGGERLLELEVMDKSRRLAKEGGSEMRSEETLSKVMLGTAARAAVTVGPGGGTLTSTGLADSREASRS